MRKLRLPAVSRPWLRLWLDLIEPRCEHAVSLTDALTDPKLTIYIKN